MVKNISAHWIAVFLQSEILDNGQVPTISCCVNWSGSEAIATVIIVVLHGGKILHYVQMTIGCSHVEESDAIVNS